MTGGLIRGYRNPGVIVAGLVLLGAAPACAAGPAASGAPAAMGVAAPVSVDTATISVSAEASASVTPDRARLRFAVETEADSAAWATRLNADATQAAIAAVRELVGEDDDVSTTGFSVSPIYSRDGDRRVTAYRTTNALVVTLTDIDLVGPVIDAAVGAGANRVDGLEFYAADSQEAYMDALARAVERARAEAEVMAAAAGGTLGRIVSLQSNRSGQPVARVMAEGMAMSATPIEPGDQSVGASVRLEVQLLSR
ncbi:MAG TPA: SIMPL domain-containing protein [Longimicrobiales bacterium]|nr:SIMPL domain-containing protein [Longimicrobiales bacterium]